MDCLEKPQELIQTSQDLVGAESWDIPLESLSEFFSFSPKKVLTNHEFRDNISKRLGNNPITYARVVELVDSLDSGSSVHCGRAGSSPASRTINRHPYGCLFFLFSGKQNLNTSPFVFLIRIRV